MLIHVAQHAEILNGSYEGQATYERLVRLLAGGSGYGTAAMGRPAIV